MRSNYSNDNPNKAGTINGKGCVYCTRISAVNMGSRYHKFREEPLVRQWILQDHMRNHYKKLDIVKPPTIATFSNQNSFSSAPSPCPNCSSRKPKPKNDILTSSLNNLSIASLEQRLSALESNHKVPFRSSTSTLHTHLASSYHSPYSRKPFPKKTLKATVPIRSQSITNLERPPFDTDWPQQRQHVHKTIASGDLLERHAQYFRAPQAPFTPKTLRKVAESKLAGSRVYNPPRRFRGSPSQTRSQTTLSHYSEPEYQEAKEDSYRDEQEDEELHPLRKSVSGRLVNTPKSHAADTRTLHTRFQARAPGPTKEEPSSGRNSSGQDSAYGEVSSVSSRNVTPAHKNLDGWKHSGLEDNVIWFKDHFGKWLDKQEDEHKYLTFLCEVTADLLTRGLCTNKKIKEIIAWHINRKRNVLNVGCVTSLMQQLCLDLQVPWDNERDGEFYGCRTPTKNTPQHNKSGAGRNDLIKTNHSQGLNHTTTVRSNDDEKAHSFVDKDSKTSCRLTRDAGTQPRIETASQDHTSSSNKRDKDPPNNDNPNVTHKTANVYRHERQPRTTSPKSPLRDGHKDQRFNPLQTSSSPPSSSVSSSKHDESTIKDRTGHQFRSSTKSPKYKSGHSASLSKSNSSSSPEYSYDDSDQPSDSKRSPMTTTPPLTKIATPRSEIEKDNCTEDDISEALELGSSNSDIDT